MLFFLFLSLPFVWDQNVPKRSHFAPTSLPHSAVLSLFFLVFLYLRPAPIGNQLLAETHVVAAMVDSNPYLQLVRLVRLPQ